MSTTDPRTEREEMLAAVERVIDAYDFAPGPSAPRADHPLAAGGDQ